MGLQFSSSHHRPESLQHLNHEISRSSRSFCSASAEPEAEADPWYYYTHGAAAYHPYTYGYGYPYYQYVLPTVKAAEEKAEEPVVEAKAAEVKPVVYTHPYLYGGIHYPYAYNYP